LKPQKSSRSGSALQISDLPRNLTRNLTTVIDAEQKTVRNSNPQCADNPDTGVRVEMGDRWVITGDFRKARLSEVIGGAGEREEGADLKPRQPIYSPLWQADGKRIRRVAPLDFIGRYMDQWFDYFFSPAPARAPAG
jgi:hypothetical protein